LQQQVCQQVQLEPMFGSILYSFKSVMINRRAYIAILLTSVLFTNCKKSSEPAPIVADPNFTVISATVDGKTAGSSNFTSAVPTIKFSFSSKVDRSTANSKVEIVGAAGFPYLSQLTYENNDSTIVLQPAGDLNALEKYSAIVNAGLKSANGKLLQSAYTVDFMTGINPVHKFPFINDSALLQLIEQQTFKYFWDFAHPVSGLARERNTSGETVTSGGSGFGIMAILVGINRNFVSRADGLARMQKIVGFLKNTAQKFHGAFPHWINGTTGAVIPFSTKDDGADLVETAYLFQGLLSARQFFNSASMDETNLRNDINSLWNAVEWDWFRKNDENVLYWHWSPNYSWDMNFPIQGWNEALITYVLAASSTTHTISKLVYDNGWARNGAIKNNNAYFGITLPLGESYGGPLFFAHYSFLGINPHDLTDAYANYWTQNVSHSLINHEYCRTNPKGFYGYGDSCWGLTASDIPNGYTASSPTNDLGVIATTAAISSLPYTPAESMKAIKFFYFILGDKIWKEYGFVDAFSLRQLWFADSFLAIDQGPQIIMIENFRSGLLWNLFMSCPEVKAGMTKLGFSSPNL
jgi:hypothetical protein